MHAYDDSIITARLQAIVTRAGNGALIRFYDGTQPAKGGAATTLLYEGTCGTPFGTIAGAVLTLNAISSGNAAASGVCTWFRVVQSDGTTFVYDAPLTDATVNQATFTAGQPVTITSYTITDQNV